MLVGMENFSKNDNNKKILFILLEIDWRVLPISSAFNVSITCAKALVIKMKRYQMSLFYVFVANLYQLKLLQRKKNTVLKLYVATWYVRQQNTKQFDIYFGGSYINPFNINDAK